MSELITTSQMYKYTRNSKDISFYKHATVNSSYKPEPMIPTRPVKIDKIAKTFIRYDRDVSDYNFIELDYSIQQNKSTWHRLTTDWNNYQVVVNPNSWRMVISKTTSGWRIRSIYNLMTEDHELYTTQAIPVPYNTTQIYVSQNYSIYGSDYQNPEWTYNSRNYYYTMFYSYDEDHLQLELCDASYYYNPDYRRHEPSFTKKSQYQDIFQVEDVNFTFDFYTTDE